MPPYGERATFGHFERLEHAVANDEAVVYAGNSGLVWILVEAAVQPDCKLPGQALRSGCGELHPVRLTARLDHAGQSRRVPVAGRGHVWTRALASAMVSDRTRASGCRMRGRGSAGRASPCQGEGRGFESRRPLGASLAQSQWGEVFPGGVAERRGNGLQIRVHGFKSRLHLGRLAQWERASLTRKRSLVQIQYRPPGPASNFCTAADRWKRHVDMRGREASGQRAARHHRHTHWEQFGAELLALHEQHGEKPEKRCRTRPSSGSGGASYASPALQASPRRAR